MKNKKIAVLLTCYNRADKTMNCLKSLISTNKNLDFRFVIADDCSTDDTIERLNKLPARIKILKGTGSLFWNGGMRLVMDYCLRAVNKIDYVLLINDDLIFYDNAITRLLERLEMLKTDVIVGATCDKNGKMTYGAIKKTSKFFAKFKFIEPENGNEQADSFNCNCVLMSATNFQKAGNLDPKYSHSMGDYDYGMHIRKLGMTVVGSDEFVALCEDNADKGSWRDPKLPRLERIRLKESPKGLPFGDWFHFVNKNYGLVSAIYHAITPYIRILIAK